MVSAEALEDWRNPARLEEAARPHYRDDLEQHNWLHAIEVRDGTRANAQRCIEHGIDIDWDVLDPTGLWHDADFWLVPRGTPGRTADHRFYTRERFSASEARKDLAELEMPDKKIKHVSDNILSSEVGVKCKTIEAKCFRQSDLANVQSSNPFVFLSTTYRQFKESKRLQGEEPPTPSLSLPFTRDFLGFAAVGYEILTAYNEEDVSLGDFDRDDEGRSLFALRMAKNIDLLIPARLNDLLSRHLADIVGYRPIGL